LPVTACRIVAFRDLTITFKSYSSHLVLPFCVSVLILTISSPITEVKLSRTSILNFLKITTLILPILFTLNSCDSDSRTSWFPKSKKQQIADSTATADSIKAYLASLPKDKTEKLKSGEGLMQVMKRLKIEQQLALKIINTLSYEVELDKLRAGKEFHGIFAPDYSKLLEFRYREDITTEHVVKIDTLTDSLVYTALTRPTETRYRLVKGTLEKNSTLNKSLIDAGIPSSISHVVSGFLNCKISFKSDARVNDEFTVVLEEEYCNDTILPSRTKILYSSYEGVRAGFQEAYRFRDSDPKSSFNAFYTPLGEALVHTGLRFPLDRIHISSSFGMRTHPVTGRFAMHNGIDYTGRIGTPVYSVAEGKIVESGYDGTSGNKVAVRHSDGTTTYYLHLNSILARKGMKVAARQKIGTIGNTGRSTGPHLHFGVKTASGSWTNPAKKNMIASPKLSGERLAMLKDQMNKISDIRVALEAGKQPVVAQKKTEPKQKKI